MILAILILKKIINFAKYNLHLEKMCYNGRKDTLCSRKEFDETKAVGSFSTVFLTCAGVLGAAYI